MLSKNNRKLFNNWNKNALNNKNEDKKPNFIIRFLKRFWLKNKTLIKYFTLIFLVLYFFMNFLLYKQSNSSLELDGSAKIYNDLFTSVGQKIDNYSLRENIEDLSNEKVFVIKNNNIYQNRENYEILIDFSRKLNFQMAVVESGILQQSTESNLYILKFRDFYSIDKEFIKTIEEKLLTHTYSEVLENNNVLYLISTDNEKYYNFLQNIYKTDININIEDYATKIKEQNTYIKLLLNNFLSGIISFFSLLISIMVLKGLLFIPIKILFSFFKQFKDEYIVFMSDFQKAKENRKKRKEEKNVSK